jgi:hypothetical protein
MRYILLVVCCFAFASAHAEAFKCLSPSGKVSFSDQPCEKGDKFIEIRDSESVQDSEAARQEVLRQKAIADKQAAENEAARRSTSGAAVLPGDASSSLTSPELSFPGASSGSGSGASGSGVPVGMPQLPTGMPQIRRN